MRTICVAVILLTSWWSPHFLYFCCSCVVQRFLARTMGSRCRCQRVSTQFAFASTTLLRLSESDQNLRLTLFYRQARREHPFIVAGWLAALLHDMKPEFLHSFACLEPGKFHGREGMIFSHPPLFSLADEVSLIQLIALCHCYRRHEKIEAHESPDSPIECIPPASRGGSRSNGLLLLHARRMPNQFGFDETTVA
jgi:hypothetical protein